MLAGYAQRGMPAYGIYGHIGADLITLASMLRIPVAMHNVPESQVFQPHCWGLFGASDDPTGADYRACKNFGPLYATTGKIQKLVSALRSVLEELGLTNAIRTERGIGYALEACN